MGLDQYGWKILKRVDATYLFLSVPKIVLNEDDDSRQSRQVTFPWWPNRDRIEFAYWRKCWPIQNYMTSLYVSRTECNEEDFNCVDLELSAQDLDDLASYFKCRRLVTEGKRAKTEDALDEHNTVISERDYEALCEFIQDAHAAIDAGMKVVYSCWW